VSEKARWCSHAFLSLRSVFFDGARLNAANQAVAVG